MTLPAALARAFLSILVLIGLVLLGWFVSVAIGVEPQELRPANEAPDVMRVERVDAATSRSSSVGDQRELVDPAAWTGQMLVVDSVHGDPVADAEVAWGDCRSRTGSDGVIAVPPADAIFSVAAAGHVGFRARLPKMPASDAGSARSPRIVLALEPAGALELRFHGERVNEDYAASVVVLPECPRVGDWSHDWPAMVRLYDAYDADPQLELTQRRDGSWWAGEREAMPARCEVHGGVARVVGLRAGERYRWGLERGGPVRMQPGHESGSAREDGLGRAVVGQRAPQLLSGRFAITAGEVRRFDVEVPATAAIRGIFPSIGAELPPQVKLYRIETITPSNGPAVANCEQLGFLVASDMGAFEFRDLTPGTYVVRSWWRSGHVVQFASAACELADRDVDLGRIEPPAGSSVFVKLDLRDRASKALVPAAEALPDVEHALGALMIHAIPASRQAHEFVFEGLPLTFETIYELRGFHPGLLSIEPQAPGWLRQPGATLAIENGPGIREPFEAGKTHEFYLAVEPRNAWLLELPPELRGRPLEVFSRSVSTGEVRRLDVRGPSHVDDVPMPRVLAPRSTQELFFRELDAPHRIAFAKIHYPPRTSTIQPEFVAGHTVDVACEGLDPGATVAWVMAGWESRQPLWSGRVDADGRCVIDGVPAGIRLIGRRRTPDVEPEAVGRSMR